MAAWSRLAGFFGELSGRSRRGDGAGAALFEAGFVEVGVGVGVEEFVGELRGVGVSTARQRMVPSLMPRRTSMRPSRSIAS